MTIPFLLYLFFYLLLFINFFLLNFSISYPGHGEPITALTGAVTWLEKLTLTDNF